MRTQSQQFEQSTLTAGGHDKVVLGHVPRPIDLAVVGDLHLDLDLSHPVDGGVPAQLVLLLVVIGGGIGGVDDGRLGRRLLLFGCTRVISFASER